MRAHPTLLVFIELSILKCNEELCAASDLCACVELLSCLLRTRSLFSLHREAFRALLPPTQMNQANTKAKTDERKKESFEREKIKRKRKKKEKFFQRLATTTTKPASSQASYRLPFGGARSGWKHLLRKRASFSNSLFLLLLRFRIFD